MIRIKVLVEGHTEFYFIRDSLVDYFARQEIFITPIILHTSKKGKGGVSSYLKIQNQVNKLCAEDTSCYVTTLFKKVIDGCTVAKAIGLDTIRQECHHFDAWVNKLIELEVRT